MMEIFLSGQIALKPTLELIKDNEERLSGRFSSRFLDSVIKTTKERLKSLPDRDAIEDTLRVSEFISPLIYPVRGSILEGLWELGEEADTGFEINFLDIPILQETIEICEELDINPYELDSSGIYLIALSSGNASLAPDCPKTPYGLVYIGHTHSQRARILRLRNTVRYLDRC